MADTKISALPDASPIAAGDALPIVRAGVTYRVAPSTLGATLFNSASASDARTAIGTDAAGATRPPSAHNHVASEITDSTVTGRSLLTAVDAGAARSAIGTDASGTARPPTAHTHVSTDITDASTIGKTVLTAIDAAAVRTAIGTDASGASRPPTAHTQTASTISDATATGQALMTAANAAAALATLGTDASGTARPPTAHTHPSTAISDSTSIGRSILTAADDAAVRTAIGTDAAGASRPPSAHTHPSTAISDATTVGKAVLTAATQADARTAIGADSPTDTRPPAAHTQAASTISDATATGIALMTAANAAAALSTLGTDAIGTARPPTAHTHASTAISDSTTIGRTILTAADAAAVRTAIGVGTGTTVASTDITDSTATGRAVLTAADAAAARTAIGTDASGATRPPSAHTHPSTDISDSSSVGRSVLTAVDAAAARTAIGVTASGPHASTHYNGGSDALAGQSISGLRTVDTPTFAGAILGTDPGGSETLRIGGTLRTSGTLTVLGTNGYFGQASNTQSFVSVTGANSGTSGGAGFTIYNSGTMVAALSNKSAILGGAYDAAPLLWAPSAITVTNGVIIGTDPGGSEALRVGGIVKCSDVTCSAWSSLGNSLNTAANAAAATQLLGVSPSRRIKYVDQFHNVFAGCQLPWAAANSGGTNTAVAPGISNVVGVVRHSSGATASANQRGGMTTTQASYLLGGARIGFGIRQAPALVLPDGTNQAIFRSGFYSAGGADDPAGGVYFRSTNGANWFAITRSGGVETATNTGVALSALGTFQDLFFDINAAGTQVRFYIGGSLVATHTTNIPSVVLLLYSNVQRVAAVATAVAFDVDLTCLALEYSTDLIPGFYD